MAFRVYVGNYPCSFTENDVKDLFRNFDGVTVEKVCKKHLKSFSFLVCKEMDTLVSLIKIMNGSIVSSRRLVVRASDTSVQEYVNLLLEDKNVGNGDHIQMPLAPDKVMRNKRIEHQQCKDDKSETSVKSFPKENSSCTNSQNGSSSDSRRYKDDFTTKTETNHETFQNSYQRASTEQSKFNKNSSFPRFSQHSNSNRHDSIYNNQRYKDDFAEKSEMIHESPQNYNHESFKEHSSYEKNPNFSSQPSKPKFSERNHSSCINRQYEDNSPKKPEASPESLQITHQPPPVHHSNGKKSSNDKHDSKKNDEKGSGYCYSSEYENQKIPRKTHASQYHSGNHYSKDSGDERSNGSSNSYQFNNRQSPEQLYSYQTHLSPHGSGHTYGDKHNSSQRYADDSSKNSVSPQSSYQHSYNDKNSQISSRSPRNNYSSNYGVRQYEDSLPESSGASYESYPVLTEYSSHKNNSNFPSSSSQHSYDNDYDSTSNMGNVRPQNNSRNGDQQQDESELAWLSVSNFRWGTMISDLYELFSDYDPVEVILLCNEPNADRALTEAHISFWNQSIADDVIMEFDNTLYEGRLLLVTDVEDLTVMNELVKLDINKS